VRPDVSPALAAIVDRALAYAPEDRWQDAHAMLQAVRASRAKAARDVLRRRRTRRGMALLALAIGGFALAASVLAPAHLRRVGDTVTSIVPALGAPDASASTHASVIPSAHASPSSRPKARPRSSR